MKSKPLCFSSSTASGERVLPVCPRAKRLDTNSSALDLSRPFKKINASDLYSLSPHPPIEKPPLGPAVKSVLARPVS